MHTYTHAHTQSHEGISGDWDALCIRNSFRLNGRRVCCCCSRRCIGCSALGPSDIKMTDDATVITPENWMDSEFSSLCIHREGVDGRIGGRRTNVWCWMRKATRLEMIHTVENWLWPVNCTVPPRRAYWISCLAEYCLGIWCLPAIGQWVLAELELNQVHSTSDTGSLGLSQRTGGRKEGRPVYSILLFSCFFCVYLSRCRLFLTSSHLFHHALPPWLVSSLDTSCDWRPCRSRRWVDSFPLSLSLNFHQSYYRLWITSLSNLTRNWS